MDETALLLFLGYLTALGVIAMSYDQELETYVEKTTDGLAGELVREFLDNLGGIKK